MKKFVHDVAARELEEYKEEMEQWKLAENIVDPPVAKKTSKRKKKTVSKSKAATATKISPPSSPKSSSISDDECGERVVDYSISSVTCNGHHIPSPSSESDLGPDRSSEDMSEDLSFLDPLFQLFDVEIPPAKKQRCVSPPVNPQMVYSCNTDFFRLTSQQWGTTFTY